MNRINLSQRISGYLAAALLPVAALNAQEMISTDRPGQTMRPGVISPGVVQLETGAQMVYDVSGSTTTRTYSLPEASVRIGVIPSMEFRVGTEYRIRNIETQSGELSTNSSTNGIGGVSVGAKVGITEEYGAMPEIGVAADLGLPAGNPAFRPEGVAPTVTLAARKSLNAANTVNLYGNVSAGWDGSSNSGTTAGYAVALQTAPVGMLGVYGEVYGSFPPGESAQHSAGVGVALPVSNDVQFDVSGGVGLTERAPDASVNVGVSIRPF